MNSLVAFLWLWTFRRHNYNNETCNVLFHVLPQVSKWWGPHFFSFAPLASRETGGAENAGVENAGVEEAGVNRTGGICRSGKSRSR